MTPRPAPVFVVSIFVLSAAIAMAQDSAPTRALERSIASPRLQAETRPQVLAVAAAKLNDPSCRSIEVVDTSFNGWTGAPVAQAVPPQRPWEETWLVDLCGRLADVLVEFAPSRDGIRVAVPARSAHLRP